MQTSRLAAGARSDMCPPSFRHLQRGHLGVPRSGTNLNVFRRRELEVLFRDPAIRSSYISECYTKPIIWNEKCLELQLTFNHIMYSWKTGNAETSGIPRRTKTTNCFSVRRERRLTSPDGDDAPATEWIIPPPHVWYANFFLPPRNMQSGSAGCKRETGCMKKRFPVYVSDVAHASASRR